MVKYNKCLQSITEHQKFEGFRVYLENRNYRQILGAYVVLGRIIIILYMTKKREV